MKRESKREQVIAERENGLTAKEIAEKYQLSIGTVYQYWKEDRKSWPEWKEWEKLNRKYGRNKN